jgi:hypothetical protein
MGGAMKKAERRRLHAAINSLGPDAVASIKQGFPRATGGKVDQLAKAVIGRAHRQVSPRRTQRG